MKACPQCAAQYPEDERFCPKDGAVLLASGPAADLVGTVVAGRYHLLRKLGEGGMGEVYLAQHLRMSRPAAVKTIRREMLADLDAATRFNREASNASRVNHPHAVQVYDFGESTDGLLFLAMEYVDGESVGALLTRVGPLPPARVARIVRQAAEALASAHDLGIVHRDVKPDNLLVARARDGGDFVKVVDFGLSKAPRGGEQSVTVSGAIIGTPAYMSPEQVAASVLDGRSDTYSLALVAFELLTGARPFTGDSIPALLSARLVDAPARLADARPDVAWPPGLQAALDRALATVPEQRFASAVDFAEALERAVGAAPTAVLAAPAREVPATLVERGAGRTSPRAFGRAAAGGLVSAAAVALTFALAQGGGRRGGAPAGVDAAGLTPGPLAAAGAERRFGVDSFSRGIDGVPSAGHGGSGPVEVDAPPPENAAARATTTDPEPSEANVRRPRDREAARAGGAPRWFLNPPTAPGFVLASATATSGDMQMALDKAEADAMHALAQRLEVRFAGVTERIVREVAEGDSSSLRDEFRRAYTGSVDLMLRGGRPRERHVEPEAGGWRAWVLAEVPSGVAARALVERIRADERLAARVRASEAFRALQAEADRAAAGRR